MTVVRELRQISVDSPAQWRGRVGEQGSIQIRYRWGVLTARVSETSSDPWENGRIVFDQEVGERMSGYLTTAEMQAALAPICHFLPEESKS
jgi:hypothetical protein